MRQNICGHIVPNYYDGGAPRGCVTSVLKLIEFIEYNKNHVTVVENIIDFAFYIILSIIIIILLYSLLSSPAENNH